jgi:hypothetical protein
MDGRGPGWLVEAALRCYPASWRRRHGHEAANLAALLIHDGMPPGSVACSYLGGAARAWLTPRSGRGLSTVAYALLVAACLLSISAALLARTPPARAATTSQTHAHARCRPGSPEPIRSMTPDTGHLQALTWQAGHGRGC